MPLALARGIVHSPTLARTRAIDRTPRSSLAPSFQPSRSRASRSSFESFRPSSRSMRSRARASASAGESSDARARATPRKSAVLSAVNESTKFVVSCAALGFLLLNPSIETCWALLGSVVNSVNGKILKRILNHERPDGSRKADPGMPSSHATSLSYLSVYGAASLAYFRDAAPALGYSGQLAVSACLVVIGMWLSYLRVSTGYHTPPQVVVGYGLGSMTALAWLFVGLKYVKPTLIAHPEMLRVLHSLLIIAIGWFAFSALHWVEGLVDKMKRKFFQQ